jgi:hypothetical protein
MPSKVREVQFDTDVVLSSTGTSSSNPTISANKASHQRGKLASLYTFLICGEQQLVCLLYNNMHSYY